MKIEDALRGVTRLGFDTAPLIYFVEAHARYDLLVIDVFRRISERRLIGITSIVTLAEVLVQPLRQQNFTLQQRYRDVLLRSPQFDILSLDPAVAERAADLRARYRLRMPDALQVAAALQVRCEAFLTNDLMLKRVTELRVLVLDELEL